MMIPRLALAFGLALALIAPAPSSALSSGEAAIFEAIENALRDAGAGERLRVETNRRDLMRRLVRAGNGNLAVEIVDFDPASRRFAAVLRLGAGESLTTTRLAGRAYEIVDLPVPRRAVPRGAELTRADLDWRPFRLDRLGADVIEDEAAIVGMTSRRRLGAGRPLRAGDLTPPVVVAKGKVVAIVLEVPGISLGTLGRALADGAEGAFIPVMNLRSKRTIEARVTSPATVRVATRAGHFKP